MDGRDFGVCEASVDVRKSVVVVVRRQEKLISLISVLLALPAQPAASERSSTTWSTDWARALAFRDARATLAFNALAVRRREGMIRGMTLSSKRMFSC